MQGSGYKPYNMRLTEDLMSCIKPQPLRCTIQEEEETKSRKSKNKGWPAAQWVRHRWEAAMKGFQLVLVLILLGSQGTQEPQKKNQPG